MFHYNNKKAKISHTLNQSILLGKKKNNNNNNPSQIHYFVNFCLLPNRNTYNHNHTPYCPNTSFPMHKFFHLHLHFIHLDFQVVNIHLKLINSAFFQLCICESIVSEFIYQQERGTIVLLLLQTY